jgi:hypothetical protein
MLLFISSCKKADEEKTELDAQVQQHNTDAASYKAELDQADDDFNNIVSNTSMGYGGAASHPLCGAIIDSSQISQKKLIIHFDGITPCFSPSRTRAGKVEIQLTSGARWGDVGSVLTETFTGYKVTRLSDNRSITFNGTKSYTNVNGNNWLAFFTGTGTLKYRERVPAMAVTFDNNLSATWNSARTTEWSYRAANANPAIPYAHIIFTSNGDTAVNGYSNADAWGSNRFGQDFTTYYHAPVVSNTYCGLWRFNSGVLVHHVKDNDFTFTLGTDKDGNATPLTCAYGFKVTWTSGKNSASVVLSY